MREIKAASLRRLDAMNEAVHLAWRVQQMKVLTKRSKTGKVTLPKLDKLMIPETVYGKKHQTPQQMKGALAALSMRYGIPVRKVKARGE